MGREFSNPTVDCTWCGHTHGVRYCCDERLAALDRAEVVKAQAGGKHD